MGVTTSGIKPKTDAEGMVETLLCEPKSSPFDDAVRGLLRCVARGTFGW
jgi:hypothetical protein